MTTQSIGLIGNMAVVPTLKIKYVLYARKSTESDERQALSIDSQVKEMLQIAERDGLDIIDIRRESHSAKESGQRPVFKEILEDIRKERYTGILSWAPDRLSRNAGDLGSVVDLMDEKKLLEIRTYGQQFKNSPNEKFLLMILCSQAKLENDNKSINVKRGLRTRVEMGLWPAPAPTGYLKEKRIDRKCQTYIDPERGHIIKQVFEKVGYEKWSGRKIYHWLKFEINFRSTSSNKGLTLSTIHQLLRNTFYYGDFEYPRKSGNWYKGSHEPLITKELFDIVQSQLDRDIEKTEFRSKEFAFTRLMTCGLCGSGICADEKIKKSNNGNVHRYVYYGCTKARDKHCKCGYLEEKELVKQFQDLIDKIDIDEIGMREKIDSEITRFKHFQRGVLGVTQKVEVGEVDIRNYVKYMLRDGSDIEKREILQCFKSKITLNNKKVSLIM